MTDKKTIAAENATLSISQFRLSDLHPGMKRGYPRLYFTIDINEEAVAVVLEQQGMTPDKKGFDLHVSLARQAARHAVADYLKQEVTPHIRSYNQHPHDQHDNYVVTDSLMISPFMALSMNSGVRVDKSTAGRFKRKLLPAGELLHMPENLQILCDALATQVRCTVEKYAETLAVTAPGKEMVFSEQLVARSAPSKSGVYKQ